MKFYGNGTIIMLFYQMSLFYPEKIGKNQKYSQLTVLEKLFYPEKLSYFWLKQNFV